MHVAGREGVYNLRGTFPPKALPASSLYHPVAVLRPPPPKIARNGVIKREFLIDNLLVRIHFMLEMIWWTGLALWEFEFPFPDRLTTCYQLNPGAGEHPDLIPWRKTGPPNHHDDKLGSDQKVVNKDPPPSPMK